MELMQKPWKLWKFDVISLRFVARLTKIPADAAKFFTNIYQLDYDKGSGSTINDTMDLLVISDSTIWYFVQAASADTANDGTLLITVSATDLASNVLVNDDIEYGDTLIVDNTDPEVNIVTPGSNWISDTLGIQWTAADNIQLQKQFVYFSSDGGGSYSLIDSVIIDLRDTAQTEDYVYDWLVPNLVSDQCILKVIVYDMVGKTDIDSTELFSIMDGIAPEIAINYPTTNYTILEYDTLCLLKHC